MNEEELCKCGDECTGILILWHQLDNYGFIRSEKLDKDVFVHLSNIETGIMPKVGMKAIFILGENKKGYSATSVRLYE